MKGQKTLSLPFNMHLFVPYLLNDSLTDANRHDWSNWSISFPFHNKSSFCESSAALFTAVTGETAAPKAAPNGKE